MDATTKRRRLEILITGYGPFMSIDNNPSWAAVKQLGGHELDLDHPPSLSPSCSVSDLSREQATGMSAKIQVIQLPVHYGSILDVVPRIHGNTPLSLDVQFWHDPRLDAHLGGKEGESFPSGYDGIEVPEAGWDVVIHVGVGRAGALRCETVAHKNGYGTKDANQQLAPLVPRSDNATIDAHYLDAQGELRGLHQGYEQFRDPLTTQVDVPEMVAWLKERGMGGDEVEQSLDAGRYLCDFVFFCSIAEAERRGRGTLVLFVHVPPEGRGLSVERDAQAIGAIAWYMARQTAQSL